MRIVVLGIVAVALLAMPAGLVLAEDAAVADTVGSAYTLALEGTTCEAHCTKTIGRILTRIDGVESAEVNFAAKQAVVTMAPGRSLTKAMCDLAFQGTQYSVVGVTAR